MIGSNRASIVTISNAAAKVEAKEVGSSVVINLSLLEIRLDVY